MLKNNTEREWDNAGKGKQPEGVLGQLPDAATVRHPECGDDLLTLKSVQDGTSCLLLVLETLSIS